MKKKRGTAYGVIGLGRFGTALAIALSQAGKEVIAVDRSEEKIIELYLKTQKDMCTTYFDKIYSRVNTLKEVENYSHKLNEYQNIIGKIIGQSQENDELNKYIKNMESKMNRKYVDIYAKQSKQSLIVVYQSKIQKLFRKVVNWFGSRA